MASKTVKISNENYVWLVHLAAELQKRYSKQISFDEVISTLKEGKIKSNKISDLAGSWNISEKEAEKMKKNMRKRWKKWEILSV